MSGFTIDELVVPAELDDSSSARDFIEMVAVRNEVEADIVGNTDLSFEAAELLPHWQMSEFDPKRMLLARVDGHIVARAIAELDTGSPIAWLSIEVLRAHRGIGIGTALHEGLLDIARSEDRDVIQAFAIQPSRDGGSRIDSPTGFGSVPRDTRETRFLLRNGYELAQVARMSRLDLPAPLDGLYSSAVDAAGPQYSVVQWSGSTPAEYRSAIALLRTRMSTDAPSGDLDVHESEWTADRVAAEDALLEASPRTRLTTLALHVPSGEAAGFTEVDVPAQRSRPVVQMDTIVPTEHRGHRLGMLLKVANLRFLAESRAGHPSVTTYNAEENRHMLSINEAIGFVAYGYEGSWKRRA